MVDDFVGQTLLGRYRVLSFVGRGGMAEVYRVWDEERATLLALKLLREDLTQDPVLRSRFRREAQTLSRLQHPNIVRFYGLEYDDSLAFILMDFVEGSNLEAEIINLRGNSFSPNRILEIMRPVCSALHYAHRQGMVHCDVKPGNVMIHSNGMVLVTDFGIARMTDTAAGSMAGTGTPSYMSPELTRGFDPTPGTDIYSLGVVLFEMLTGGKQPFDGERAPRKGSLSERVQWEQSNLEPSSLKVLPANYPSEIETIVFNCLAVEPETRYENALDFLLELTTALGMEEEARSEDDPVSVGPTIQVVTRRAPARPDGKGTNQASEPDLVEEGHVLFSEETPQEDSFSGEEKEVLGSRLSPVWLRRMMFFGSLILLSAGALTAVLAGTEGRSSNTSSGEISMDLPPTQDLKMNSTRVSAVDGMEMVFVPAGEFLMGSTDSDASAWDDEKPQHVVDLDAFWIDTTEVTNSMFAAFLNKNGNQLGGGVLWVDENGENLRLVLVDGRWQVESGYDNYPIIDVTWYGAERYCKWAERRLPWEAEWEKAARGENGQRYPWGNGQPTCSQANYAGCEGSRKPVGASLEGGSPYGALDMAGNVWEWVADWYVDNQYRISIGEDPQDPSSHVARVVRGGSWFDVPRLLRSANRYSFLPVVSWYRLGFRCAADVIQ